MPIIAGQDIDPDDFNSYIDAGFGGDGSDGAQTITSGATNVDCGAAQVVVLNYTTLSITGTGSLTFSNPHANGTTVIIRVQGGVTLTSSTAPMVNMSGMGGLYGAAIAAVKPPSDNLTNGNIGTTGIGFSQFKTKAGGGGSSSASVAGTVPTAFDLSTLQFSSLAQRYPHTFVGAGGGSGAVSGGGYDGSGTSGRGGRGGGCLIIECNGAWNFTTANGISVAGENGGNAGSIYMPNNATAYGGGGGGGGFFLGMYHTLTANSGTVNVAGGTGGTNTLQGPGSSGSGGAGGGSAMNPGTSSPVGTNPTNGVGGSGLSVVIENNSQV